MHDADMRIDLLEPTRHTCLRAHGQVQALLQLDDSSGALLDGRAPLVVQTVRESLLLRQALLEQFRYTLPLFFIRVRPALLHLKKGVEERRLGLPALTEAREVEVLVNVQLDLHTLILHLGSRVWFIRWRHHAYSKMLIDDHDAESLEVETDLHEAIDGKVPGQLGHVPLRHHDLFARCKRRKFVVIIVIRC